MVLFGPKNNLVHFKSLWWCLLKTRGGQNRQKIGKVKDGIVSSIWVPKNNSKKLPNFKRFRKFLYFLFCFQQYSLHSPYVLDRDSQWAHRIQNRKKDNCKTYFSLNITEPLNSLLKLSRNTVYAMAWTRPI